MKGVFNSCSTLYFIHIIELTFIMKRKEEEKKKKQC